MALDAELRELLRALELISIVETTEDAEKTSDGRWEVEVQVVNPPTGDTAIAEVAGVSRSRQPKKGEQYVAARIGGKVADMYLLRRTARPGDLLDDESGTYLVTPEKDEDVHVKVRGAGKSTIEVENGASFVVEGNNVTVTSGNIKLGSSAAAMAVALAPKVAQVLAQRDGVFAGHFHTYVVPLIPIAGAPTTPPVPSTLGTGDMSATKVKGE